MILYYSLSTLVKSNNPGIVNIVVHRWKALKGKVTDVYCMLEIIKGEDK